MISAFLATKRVASSHQMMLRDFPANLAENPVRPTVIFQPFKTSRIVWELLLEVGDRVLFHVRYLSLPTPMVS